MFLSKLTLNRTRQAMGWLARPYRVHQRLCMAAGGDPRLLYRIEAGGEGEHGPTAILAQTHQEPAWQTAFGDFLVLAEMVQCKEVQLSLSQGQMLAFRLRANPTARRRLKNGGKKRVGLTQEEEQRDWLRRKAEAGGFGVLHVWLRQEPSVLARVEDEQTVHRAKLVAVQFEGILQVTDPERLETTVAQGIGSGKGLGFGLLSLAPMRG